MSIQFRAAVWHGGDTAEVETLTLDELRPNDVLIRVAATNVNVSEHILLLPENEWGADPLPQVIGHGTVGIVEAVGPAVTDAKSGDRVVATSTPNCGRCWFCQRGHGYQCAEMRVVGLPYAHDADDRPVYGSAGVGGFAELAVVPQAQVTCVHTPVSDAEIALLAVGYGSGIGAALRTAPVEPGTVAAAVGLGVSGLAYVQGARLAGASTIIAIDPIAGRRELARRFGATHVVDPAHEDPVGAVRRIGGDHGGLQGAGADFVFDAAATLVGMQQAFEMTRSTGHVVLSSIPYNMADMLALPAVAAACLGRTIHSNQYGSLNVRRDIPFILDLVQKGMLDIGALIDAEYRLDRINEAIADTAAHRVLGASVVFPT